MLPPPSDAMTIMEIFTQIGSVFVFIYAQYLEPFIGPHIPFLKTISVILSLLFFAGIVFSVLRFRDARMKEAEYYKPIDIEAREASRRMTQWEVVLNHLAAENPAEWRLAILEADTILEDTLRNRGFEGDNIGERLRGMTEYDLKSLQDAWEAHKVRNSIAHEGSDFGLTRRRAQQAISQYEKVLSELGYL